jgi:NCS1 family nucleobase:cation symporter-1
MRSSFGTVGANIPALARALVACGWFGIQTWIGGDAIYQVFGALGWIDIAADKAHLLSILGVSGWQFACFGIFWAINVYFIWNGMNSIKWLESWAAPFLIAAGLALLVWAMVKVSRIPESGGGGVAALFTQGSSFKTTSGFWQVFAPQLTAMVGFWATLSLNIPDFTRFARDQKSQAVGQALGLPTTMTLFCFIGIVVTGATTIIFHQTITDPVALVARLGSPLVIVVSLVALSVATLSTNIAANVVSPANDISNLSPRRISFRAGGMITAAIGVLMMPWYLYTNLGAYIFTWLIGYSALLGPIAGIMLCDYYLLRRTRLNVAALYDPSPSAEFSFGGGGINWRAVLVLALAVAPNLPGFINAATNRTHAQAAADPSIHPIFPAFFDTLYGYAWFVGLALAMGLYYPLMRGRARPAH